MSTTIYLIEKISDDDGNETVRDNAHDLATRWWNGRAFAYTLHSERWGEFESATSPARSSRSPRNRSREWTTRS